MSTGALLEAMLEAVLAAKSQDFQKILVLSNSKSLMQTYIGATQLLTGWIVLGYLI